MSDKIKLLSDRISNQIAAGEVIQRPASVVKELLENSIDAGSTEIKLIIKNAGKTLIQVVDNGSGMTDTDARMCFEKHATSKIADIDDLFKITSMGFRGEAMASIAAVAQVQLKTRTEEHTVGTQIAIEGSRLIKQEDCSCPLGTSITAKNLFFNIPARRNFLKSDPVELKHIFEEFFRAALSHPDIAFSLSNNGDMVHQLKPGKLRQRIVALFGKNMNERLVPLNEETEGLKVFGYVGKPEFAKKTRGEQYIFVNRRFIKSHYLNHAVNNAYEQMINKDSFPFFVLFVDIDPAKIDINVHPSKHEIKFEDERLIYTFIHSGTKHALGQFSIAPSLDFNQEYGLGTAQGFQSPFADSAKSKTKINPDFNPFEVKKEANLKNWEKLFDVTIETDQQLKIEAERSLDEQNSEKFEPKSAFQLHKQYIIYQVKSGMLIIDQRAAHERILFDDFMLALQKRQGSGQQLLFPKTVNLNSEDAALLKVLEAELKTLGFDIEAFGGDTYIIRAIPPEIGDGNEEQLLEELLEQFKSNAGIDRLEKLENLARSLASCASVKRKEKLEELEMQHLIDRLFACPNPEYTASGKRVFITFGLDYITQKFNK